MAANKPRFPVLKTRQVMGVEEISKIVSSVKDDLTESEEINRSQEPDISVSAAKVETHQVLPDQDQAEELDSLNLAWAKPSFDSFMQRLTEFEGDKYFSGVVYEPIKDELQKIAFEQKTTVAALSNTILYKWLLMYKPEILSSRKQLAKKKSII